MRTIIIGDIHGCFQELLKLLDKVEFDQEKDRLISLGDLMDRGKQSYEVYRYFRDLKEKMGERCIIIRGNHEQMMMDAVSNPDMRNLWKQNGGTKTIHSFYQHMDQVYPHALWFYRNTVLFYEDEWFQCAHAGLSIDGLSGSTADELLWDRDRIDFNDYNGKLTIVGHTPAVDAAWYAGDGEKPHVISEKTWMPLPGNGIICLDTGCVFGFRLTAMIIKDREFMLDSVFQNYDYER